VGMNLTICPLCKCPVSPKPKRQVNADRIATGTTAMISVSEEWIDQMWASFCLEQKAAGISAAMEL